MPGPKSPRDPYSPSPALPPSPNVPISQFPSSQLPLGQHDGADHRHQQQHRRHLERHEVVGIERAAHLLDVLGIERAAGALDAKNIEQVGRALYTDYLVPFEVASVLLLVAMVGAIMLAKRER